MFFDRLGRLALSRVRARGRSVLSPLCCIHPFDSMNHDAMNDSDQSSHDRSSTSGKKPADDTRKPFVKPELRREVGVVDGTGTTTSFTNTYDEE